MRAGTARSPAELSEEVGLWLSARKIFERVLAAPPAERRQRASALCGSDLALAKAVFSLLAWDIATSRPEIPAVAARDPEPDRTGTLCGGYLLVRKLGHGGAGVVYLAEKPGNDPPRYVAIKLLSRTLCEEARLCLVEESRILAHLDHPGIARLIEGGIGEDGQVFLSMEWIDGDPLTVFSNARRLTLSARLALFREVCRAVEHTHQRLVVHLDLKPQNILVDRAGRPRLLDFGIAQLLGDDLGSSRRAVWLSPGYASPEQALGEPVSQASDVYSLGIILFEMLTGIRPQPEDPEELLTFLSTGAPHPSEAVLRAAPGFAEASAAARRLGSAEALAERLAGGLDSVVRRCLERRPEHRYSSAGQLARALSSIQLSETDPS